MERTPTRPAALLGVRLGSEVFSADSAGNLVIHENGHQHPVKDLVVKYGSPLEIFLPHVAASRVKNIIGSFARELKSEAYDATFSYHYPMKVNQRKEVVRTVLDAGAQIETSSANELDLVRGLIESGEASSSLRILSNGPKTSEYLARIRAMQEEGYDITPIIEDDGELRELSGYPGKVGIRVDLNVKIKSHWDRTFNRFGFSEKALLALGAIPNLTILSYHISSQIEEVEGFIKPLERAMKLYAALRLKNPGLSTLNIGGGAGIAYNKSDFYTTEDLVEALVAAAKKEADRLGIPAPHLICEWGRHAIAPAQISIFKVIGEKNIVDGPVSKWYVIDGSFIANLADTWAIGQKWHITPVTRMLDKKRQRVWLAGSSCDSDDEYKGADVLELPILSDEDLHIVVYDTGAYQNALASYHCLLSHPARIMLEDGAVTPLREKDTAQSVGALFGW